MTDRILHSRQVLTPEGLRPAAVWIADGRIERVTDVAEMPPGVPVEVMGDRVLMSGLVDTHVHINEPGRTEWEGFETATHAAAAGGITTLIDMPLNSIPVTTSVAALEAKLAAAQSKLWVDCGFYGGIVPGNTDQIRPLAEAGVRGFKCFLIHSGIDDFPNVTEADLREAMPVLTQTGLPLLVHAELCESAQRTVAVDNPQAYQAYLASRPRQWELDAIALMIRLCLETGCPVHIVHLSCADALPMIAEARAEGLPLTVETCTHYLCLSAEDVPAGATRYKCAPPIRERENADRLWQGLADGVIDFIISDHSPCTPELKLPEAGDFLGAWGGISSVQLGLPAVWTEARKRGYTIEQLARWMSEAPARFVGLAEQKGRLVPGLDADLVAWDPNAQWIVRPDLIYHRHKVTPYEGQRLDGVIHRTWLRGQLVYSRDGGEAVFPAGPIGRPLLQPAHSSV